MTKTIKNQFIILLILCFSNFFSKPMGFFSSILCLVIAFQIWKNNKGDNFYKKIYLLFILLFITCFFGIVNQFLAFISLILGIIIYFMLPKCDDKLTKINKILFVVGFIIIMIIAKGLYNASIKQTNTTPQQTQQDTHQNQDTQSNQNTQQNQDVQSNQDTQQNQNTQSNQDTQQNQNTQSNQDTQQNQNTQSNQDTQQHQSKSTTDDNNNKSSSNTSNSKNENNSSKKPPIINQENNTADSVVYAYNHDCADLHEKPSAKSRVLGRIPNGTHVTVLSNGNYCKVKVNGATGYIYGRYIK